MRTTRSILLIALSLCSLLPACDSGTVADAGMDAASVSSDGSTRDATASDLGRDLGTAPDQGPVADVGPTGTDTGPGDTGTTDTGPTDAGPTDAGPTDAGPQDAGVAFTLQLLHTSDGEANPNTVMDLPRFAAILSALRATQPASTITLASGDNWIPGPFLEAQTDSSFNALVSQAARARVDIAAMNAMGFQASCFGNHEFDRGTSEIYAAIAPRTVAASDAGMAVMWPGASFPYLSANLTFNNDPAASNTTDPFDLVIPDAQNAQPGKISRSTIITVNGQRIGVVGATTPLLPSIASPGNFVAVAPPLANAMDMAMLAAIIQPEVDELTTMGIDKIIVLTHLQQLTFERALAPLLRNVDILVGGGSNTRLMDSTDVLRAGDTRQGNYPEMFTNASGDPLALVNTDGLWKYVGRLVVGFDASGRLIPSTIDPNVSGAYATDAAGLARVPGASLTDPMVMRVAELTGAVGTILAARESVQFGYSTVFLEGRRTQVRTQETNLGVLSTDALLWWGKQVDPTVQIAIRNSGGVRAEIGYIYVPPGAMGAGDTMFLPPQAIPMAGKEEGEISRFDIETALSFNNATALVTLTRSELRAMLEHAVASTDVGVVAAGQFGQIAGMRFSYDPTLPAGSRVRNAAIVNAAGVVVDRLVEDGVLRADASRATIRLATLGFLADCGGSGCAACTAGMCGPTCRGGDGFPLTATCLSAPNRVNLLGMQPSGAPNAATFAMPGSEQDTLAEYLAATHPTLPMAFMSAEVPASMDTRIQNLTARGGNDTVF